MNDWKYSKGKAREHIRGFVTDAASQVLLTEALAVDLIIANPSLECAEAYERGKERAAYVMDVGAEKSRIDIDKGRKVYKATVCLCVSESSITQLRAQIDEPTGSVYLTPAAGSDTDRARAWKRLQKFRTKALVAEAKERRKAAARIQG